MMTDDTLNPDFPLGRALVSGCPSQTRSLSSGGSIHSRSASELLLVQKTKLPCLTTVCSGQPDTVSNDVSGLKMDVLQFDKIAREVFAPAYVSIAEQIKEKTGITQGICLDVGSGGGYLDIALAGITDMVFFLLDQSHEMLGIAERNIAESHLERRLFTLHGDVHSIPLDGGSVDLVISRGSVSFWENRTRAFGEIYRVLRPGGRAYIGGGLGSPEIRKQIQAKMKERDHTWHDRSKRNEDHRKEYEEALKNAGITNCSVTRGEEGSWIEMYKQC